jgi:DNA-binding LacI/PurR family transcriptional regulator
LDGSVIWTGWLGQFVGAAEATRFCKRLGPLPTVSISQKIDGIPSILSDNYQSMACVVRHLVDVHQCRRLAFINGPQNHIESA